MLAKGFYCYFIGHFECSKNLIERALELSKIDGIYIYSPNIISLGCFCSLTSQDLLSAKQYLTKMDLCIKDNKLNGFLQKYYYLFSWYLWLNNDISSSLEYIEMGLTLAKQLKETISLSILHIAASQLFIEYGKYSIAANHLASAEQVINLNEFSYIKYKFLLAKSLLEFKKNNNKQGLDYLKEALLLGKEKNIVFIDFFYPYIMSQLFIKALIAKIEVEYVQEVIQKLKLTPNDPYLDYDCWPRPIKIFTLGNFYFQKDGKVLKFSGKVQKKPMQLLKVLISFGGKNISEEKLSDVLWPDSDGDMAHKAFATTLHRLRKLLGNEKILKFQEKKLSIDINYCFVDSMAFESMLMRAEKVYREGKKEIAIDIIKNALALYQGNYMTNDEESWTIVYRNRLKNKFYRHVEELAKFFQENGQLKDAIECLEKAIEKDMLAENLYQHLMICLKKSGQKAQAISVYKSCRNALGTTLGIKPSIETENIYNSL